MGQQNYKKLGMRQVAVLADGTIQPGLKQSAPMMAKSNRVDDPAAVGARLRLLRKAFSAVQQYPKLMSQAEMARRVGTTVQNWNNAEQGYSRLGLDTALEVVKVTGATLDFIYRNERGGMPRALSIEIEKLEAEPVKQRA